MGAGGSAHPGDGGGSSTDGGGGQVTATHSSSTGGGTHTTPRTGSSATSTTSGPFEITGQLFCESGHAVVGVWVQAAHAADSRYAAWKGVGDGSTADWWTDLPKNESYSLHVGCGGTPSSWGTSNTTAVYSGGHNSFNCDDIAGDPRYGECTHR
jgi:hypothetical protein